MYVLYVCTCTHVYIITELGMMAYRLDGDNVRFGLNKDLAFSEKDRKENIRRFFPPSFFPFFSSLHIPPKPHW